MKSGARVWLRVWSGRGGGVVVSGAGGTVVAVGGVGSAVGGRVD